MKPQEKEQEKEVKIKITILNRDFFVVNFKISTPLLNLFINSLYEKEERPLHFKLFLMLNVFQITPLSEPKYALLSHHNRLTNYSKYFEVAFGQRGVCPRP